MGTPDQAIAPYARSAYAAGWAASGGPMTDRVRAGCVAAVEYAVEHADDPTILEVTLHLGHLEGVWAAVFDRRQKLHADANTDVMGIWADLTADLNLPDLIRQVRQHTGLGEVFDPATAAVAAVAAALVAAMLRGLTRKKAWAKLQQIVRDVIAKARAEGHADAVAVAADAADRISIDFAIPFTDAYNALKDAESLLSDTDGWLHDLLGDAADAVGRRLATLAADGAPYEDMVAAVEGLISGEDARAVTTAIDLLVSRAMSQGALDLYASEGVTHVDFLTAGDARVCPRCSDLEANNPYPLAQAPRPGIHPMCRCVLAATVSSISALAFTRYRTPTEASPATAAVTESAGGKHHQDHHDHNRKPDYTAEDLGVPDLFKVRVDPRDVRADHRYQRRLNQARVDHYAQEKRRALKHRHGLLAIRPDSTLWVINGQHHTAAAVEQGVKHLTYQAFVSDGWRDEARVYAAWQAWHDEYGHPDSS